MLCAGCVETCPALSNAECPARKGMRATKEWRTKQRDGEKQNKRTKVSLHRLGQNESKATKIIQGDKSKTSHASIGEQVVFSKGRASRQARAGACAGASAVLPAVTGPISAYWRPPWPQSLTPWEAASPGVCRTRPPRSSFYRSRLV